MDEEEFLEMEIYEICHFSTYLIKSIIKDVKKRKYTVYRYKFPKFYSDFMKERICKIITETKFLENLDKIVEVDNDALYIEWEKPRTEIHFAGNP